MKKDKHSKKKHSAIVSIVVVPTDTRTDDGVPYEAIDTQTIVNTAKDTYDARRRELRVHGHPYHHVAEDVLGRWIYRHDS